MGRRKIGFRGRTVTLYGFRVINDIDYGAAEACIPDIEVRR